VHVDRFGDLITNLTPELLPARQQLRVQIAGREVSGPVASYARGREGELLALFGSSGYLEIAMRNGNAAAVLQAGSGTPVVAVFKRKGRAR
jgi:S-adenosylmethionine hydrolase